MLDRKQVCKYLGISIPTLTRYMAKGLLVYYKAGESKTSKVMFKEEDVDAFLNRIKK